jgi:hypothetical protein
LGVVAVNPSWRGIEQPNTDVNGAVNKRKHGGFREAAEKNSQGSFQMKWIGGKMSEDGAQIFQNANEGEASSVSGTRAFAHALAAILVATSVYCRRRFLY